MTLGQRAKALLRPLANLWRECFRTVEYWIRRALRRIQGRSRTLLIYPAMNPNVTYTLRNIVRKQGYRVTEQIDSSWDAAIYFEDDTHREPPEALKLAAARAPVLNLTSTDISKTHVAKVFEEVFGYGIEVDPLTFHGRCIQKTDKNSVHDETILDCPVNETLDGMVYQRLILGRVDGHLQELRVPVIRGKIPYIYDKRTPGDNPLDRAVASYVRQADELFSAEEQALIARFVARLGMDFAELDMARNTEDARLYIFDANHTPTFFNGGGLSRWKQRQIQQELSDIFDREFLPR